MRAQAQHAILAMLIVLFCASTLFVWHKHLDLESSAGARLLPLLRVSLRVPLSRAFFLNLDSRPDRRRYMEAMFRDTTDLDASLVERFPGITITDNLGVLRAASFQPPPEGSPACALCSPNNALTAQTSTPFGSALAQEVLQRMVDAATHTVNITHISKLTDDAMDGVGAAWAAAALAEHFTVHSSKNSSAAAPAYSTCMTNALMKGIGDKSAEGSGAGGGGAGGGAGEWIWQEGDKAMWYKWNVWLRDHKPQWWQGTTAVWLSHLALLQHAYESEGCAAVRGNAASKIDYEDDKTTPTTTVDADADESIRHSGVHDGGDSADIQGTKIGGVRGRAGKGERQLKEREANDAAVLVMEDDFQITRRDFNMTWWPRIAAAVAAMPGGGNAWDTIRLDCTEWPLRAKDGKPYVGGGQPIYRTHPPVTHEACGKGANANGACYYSGGGYATVYRCSSIPRIVRNLMTKPVGDYDGQLCTNNLQNYCVNWRMVGMAPKKDVGWVSDRNPGERRESLEDQARDLSSKLVKMVRRESPQSHSFVGSVSAAMRNVVRLKNVLAELARILKGVTAVGSHARRDGGIPLGEGVALKKDVVGWVSDRNPGERRESLEDQARDLSSKLVKMVRRESPQSHSFVGSVSAAMRNVVKLKNVLAELARILKDHDVLLL